MDVWIVAAAAGAGYVAQRLKNLTIRKHNPADISSENLNVIRRRELACSDASLATMASTSGFDGDNLAELANWGVVSDSNSLAGLLKKEDVEWDWEERMSSDKDEVVITSDSVPQPSSREIGFSYGFGRNKSSIRSRQLKSKFTRPQTSLESCLMAQLYKENAEIEEYTYSVCPPRKPTVRPFLVSDGSRIISKAPHQSCSKPVKVEEEYKQSKDTHSQGNKAVSSVPRLPKTGKEGKTCKVVNGSQHNPQGSLDGTLLFLLGLTMGISYSLSGHKQEMDNLRKSLKQTENLVQDLQEELDMKDVLTVKELTAENHESPVNKDSYFDDGIQTPSFEPKFDSSSVCCNDGNNDQKAKEESLRKIEAELEAELVRLGSNINSSGLERRLSNVAELDQDFVPYTIKGELRADLFGPETETYTERDESSGPTPHSAHYPVSPKELSLRLHEVIQSRLQERVKELEAELEYSQMKIRSIESEHIHPWEEVPGHKTESSSNHESPNATDHSPVIINLSGEALSAYNEVYDELAKLSESDEDCRHEEMFHLQRQDCENDVMCSSSRDESEDELEKLLIRQIVEKARQGSPAVLKAQRAFLSTHEN